MEYANKFDLIKYYEYIEFINECKSKVYNNNIVIHKHHIRPKHMCFDDELLNSSNNIVKLSVDDHIKAHLMLADMYNEGEYEYISNMRSARILNNKSIKDKNILDKISKTYEGENNPFYGKTHNDDVKKKISKATIDNRKDKTYEEIYGSKERAEIERDKRSKKTRTDEEYKKCGKKISETLKGTRTGSKNPFAKKIKVDGILYGSVVEAKRELGISRYKLYKYHKVKEVK